MTMTQRPLISFITVTYQAMSVLEPTLDRFLDQTTGGFECLIIDGGSNDGTLDIMTTYAPRFAEKGIDLRWISEPDHGLYDAMNKGMAMAKGHYIWFMNAGDRLAGNDTVQQVHQSIQTANNNRTALPADELPDFIHGETLVVDQHYNKLGFRRLKAPKDLQWKHFKWGMLVCHQAMLIKQEMATPFNLHYKYSSDYDWAIRCLKTSKKTLKIDQVVCEFMDGGLTKKKMKASLKERYRIMVYHYGWLSTSLLHLWFVVRAAWFKLRHGWI